MKDNWIKVSEVLPELKDRKAMGVPYRESESVIVITKYNRIFDCVYHESPMKTTGFYNYNETIVLDAVWWIYKDDLMNTLPQPPKKRSTMLKIVFVGIHNKKDKAPLCSSTVTGRTIDLLIKEIVKKVGGFEFEKTNLYPVNYLPDGFEKQYLEKEFKINEDFIYVGFGKSTVGAWMDRIGLINGKCFNHPSYMNIYKKKDIPSWIDEIVEYVRECSLVFINNKTTSHKY